MNDTMYYKGYYGSVLFSDCDNIFYGKIIGICDRITYDGDSAASLRCDFENAVDEYLEICSQFGRLKNTGLFHDALAAGRLP